MTFPIVSPFTDNSLVTKAQLDVLTAAVNAAGVNAAPIVRQVGRSTTLSVTDSLTTSAAAFPDQLYNVGDIAYGAGVFTVGTAGMYHWSATSDWPVTTTSHSRHIFITVNGVQPGYKQGRNTWTYPAITTSGYTLTAGGLVVLSGNDAVALNFYQTSGSTLAIVPATFGLARIG